MTGLQVVVLQPDVDVGLTVSIGKTTVNGVRLIDVVLVADSAGLVIHEAGVNAPLNGEHVVHSLHSGLAQLFNGGVLGNSIHGTLHHGVGNNVTGILGFFGLCGGSGLAAAGSHTEHCQHGKQKG